MDKLLDLWSNIISPEGYMPHGHCYLWQTPLVWLHVTSDVLIGLAYFSIPLCLVYFVRRAENVPFRGIFQLFSLFIIACGLTHFAEVWTLWHPAYWLSGSLKALTAVISVYTSIKLVPTIPQALSLKSPKTLQILNEQLQNQIQERTVAEAKILTLNQQLESRIEARTLSLAETNERLTKEVAIRRRAEESFQIANNKLADQLAQLEQFTAVQTCISELSETLQICHSLEEAFKVSAKLIKGIFPNCRGYIFMARSVSSSQLDCVAKWGDQAITKMITSLEQQDCWGIRKSTPHISDLEGAGLCCEHLQGSPAAMIICVPLIIQGEVLGLFQLESDKVLEPLTQGYAKNVADQLALSFKNLKLRGELKIQSYSDPLTGLYNRRYLEIYLTQRFSGWTKEDRVASLILFDVDHFKMVNDTYGHDAGDLVLQYIAQFLKVNVRNIDLICRYGGEEILVVLPNAPLQQAYQRAEILRQGIQQLKIRHEQQFLPSITVSAGVANFSDELNTVTKVLKAVDQALYQAKDEGRNCVISVGLEVEAIAPKESPH
ncbi:diguanylate cyclase [[Leptolyngbya] sp. PCC 7376]|uniref:GGDEF domain-containing protein n=1 Tax=[Leptolyngbya] sp. PCC 7376 TaxID=111781 RepID=UPI00029F42E6|nr:sensor domain-containing diguanylate cyclase [[Leptolyngbya] sp. PCC 7376]AFY38047.1 diguanylate cyclase [[Leptolyngbya] sp. PCC 7376]